MLSCWKDAKKCDPAMLPYTIDFTIFLILFAHLKIQTKILRKQSKAEEEDNTSPLV